MIHTHPYDNGLTLLIEPIEGVASAAMTLLLPAGVAYEPADRLGVCAVLSDCLFRGAGDLDAKAHSDAMDTLGIKRGCGVQTYHTRLGATFIGDRFNQALPLLMDMILRPQLTEEGFAPARELAVQAIDALEDEPQQKLMIELKAAHLPEPMGRSDMGRRDHLLAMTAQDVRDFHARTFVPDGAILSFAGHVDPQAVIDTVGEHLGQWTGTIAAPAAQTPPTTEYHHTRAETAQQHIGIAYDAVPQRDDQAILQRVAAAVLSGGMSGRLFTEVREKRGLCYSVYASYSSLIDQGVMMAYAGTTTERAAETLEVLGEQLRAVHDGVMQDEFDRAIVGLKTRVVMQGESTSARARAIASDHFLLGQARTLDACAQEIDAVTLPALNEYLLAHRPGPMTTVTIGPEPLIEQQA